MSHTIKNRDDPNYIPLMVESLTLRDWFAGQALNTLCSLANESDYEDLPNAKAKAERLARSAYNIADAMLADRTRKLQGG